MSAELSLEDLEMARDEVTAAVMTVLETALVYPDARGELVPAVLKMVAATGTLNRAIEAHGEEPSERANDG
ncbi:MAG TPA: hypothetical protein VMI54_04175 [Polyangiaceae bacterium]|nr:hypothetical protein [Polyangiaceae bacterium]